MKISLKIYNQSEFYSFSSCFPFCGPSCFSFPHCHGNGRMTFWRDIQINFLEIILIIVFEIGCDEIKSEDKSQIINENNY